jgi:hypothetical protein
MLAIDHFFIWPVLIYPMYYAVEGAVKAREPRVGLGVAASLQRYREDFLPVNRASMMVWVPANLINFALISPAFRTSFMGMTAFMYTTFWSWQQARLRDRADVDARRPTTP